MIENRELVVIGGGPAGLTAAIYGRRAGLDVLLLEKGIPGGQINITSEIENWPGVKRTSGAELGVMFKEHAQAFNTEFRSCSVEKIETRGDKRVVITDKGEIEAEAVIIASGAYFRKLGCKGEEKFTGAGVSYCAVCDGAFFQDLEIAVVGGGNTAVEEAVYLTTFASKVYIIHRRDEFRADRAAVAKALSNEKIVPVWNTVVEEISGNGMVDKLIVKNVRTGEVSDLPVSGVFIFVGQAPYDEFCKGLLKCARGGWIETNEDMETSIEGIYAAGDVRSKHLRQVVTAASDGATAAMSASSFINEQVHLRSTLLEPEEVDALFYSSIDEAQVKISGEIDKFSEEKGKKIAIIDGYRNSKMAEKLGIKEMPTLVKLKKGNVAQKIKAESISDIASFWD